MRTFRVEWAFERDKARMRGLDVRDYIDAIATAKNVSSRGDDLKVCYIDCRDESGHVWRDYYEKGLKVRRV